MHIVSGVVSALNVALLVFVLAIAVALPLVPTSRAAATVDVSIVNLAFQPADVTIQPGDTVRWTNTVSTTHSVVSDTGAAEAFSSSPLGLNEVFTHTFTTVGDSNYHCGFHATMLGTVHVSTSVPEFSSLPIVLLGLVALVAGISAMLGKR